MINIYEELIIKKIVSSLTLDSSSLRWFPVVPMLPSNDCDLFSLFDIVPNDTFIANTNDQSPLFSTTYGKLLDAQEKTFISDLAKKNYANESYWLNCSTTKKPIFKPNSAEITTGLSGGSSFDFTFDSSNYPSPPKELFPSYPSFLVFQPFLNFNETAENSRFVFKLHFDKIAHISTQLGGWFTQGAFVKAYQDKSTWKTGSNLVTWDELFGTNGILNWVTNGLLVASGMTLEIQIFGKYDLKTLFFLKTNLLTSVWPFYLSPENATNSFDMSEDGNITITVTTSKTQKLLLALQAESINGLITSNH